MKAVWGSAVVFSSVVTLYTLYHWPISLYSGGSHPRAPGPRPRAPGPRLLLYRNVCIETDPVYGNAAVLELSARIVIYDNRSDYAGGMRINPPGPGNPRYNQWDVTFASGEPPRGHVMMDSVAFFTAQTCPGNLYHFWTELFAPLHSAIQRMRRTGPHMRNDVLYRYPPHPHMVLERRPCYSTHAYERFLAMLRVHMSHDVYWMTSPGTCFPRGVFGLQNVLAPGDEDAVTFVSQRVRPEPCVNRTFVIVQRQPRRLLNADAVSEVVSGYGFTARVVHMEEHDVDWQVGVVRCARVLLGVSGAALQWGVFLERGAGLVEVAWPERHWRHTYTTQFSGQGLLVVPFSVEPHNVHVNWSSYEMEVTHGASVPAGERERLLRAPPVPPDHPWKWADVTVNIARLRDTIRYLHKHL